MEIREADIAAMGRAELEQVIDRAVRPDVPLRVLFAALDRYTELLRPALDDEPAPAAAPTVPPAPPAPARPRASHRAPAPPIVVPVSSGPPGPPDPPGPPGPPGTPGPPRSAE